MAVTPSRGRVAAHPARSPIILSSGYSEQEVAARFAGKGLAGFLKKPYEPAELTAALHRAPERRVIGYPAAPPYLSVAN